MLCTAGFIIFPFLVALVHKKPYVNHLSCRRVGQGAPSLTFDQTTSSSVSLFSKRTAHHDGQRLWGIALPVALPPPIRMAPLYPNTMGDALTLWFCRNQRWGQVIGGVLQKKIQSVFFTHNNQLQRWLIASPVAPLRRAAAKLLPPLSCRRRRQAARHYRTAAATAALPLQPPWQCCVIF